MSGKAFSREFKLAALAQMDGGEKIANRTNDVVIKRTYLVFVTGGPRKLEESVPAR